MVKLKTRITSYRGIYQSVSLSSNICLSIDKELRHVCDGRSGISSHSFRRTLLTEFCRDGWSLREIQHISAYGSLQSLQEYLDVEKEEVVDKFRQRMGVAA